MSECDATVGQVAKGTTASFALGPHGASVCGRTEHALPGVEVVGGVFGGKIVPFAPAVGVFSCVGGAFGGRIVPFAPVGAAFFCVGEVFGLVVLDFVPVGGVDVDEIGDFGALGTVFGLVCGGSDGVCGVFWGVALSFVPADGVDVDEIGDFALVGAVFGLVCEAFGGVCGVCAFAVGVFGSASAVFGAAAGETGAKRSASDGAGGADVDEATEEGAAERRLD